MTSLELEQTCEDLRTTLLDTIKKLDAAKERPSRLLTEAQTAKYLNVSPSTLENWRNRNFGPRCLEFDGKEENSKKKIIRYDIEDLDRWATECPRRKEREA